MDEQNQEQTVTLRRNHFIAIVVGVCILSAAIGSGLALLAQTGPTGAAADRRDRKARPANRPTPKSPRSKKNSKNCAKKRVPPAMPKGASKNWKKRSANSKNSAPNSARN